MTVSIAKGLFPLVLSVFFCLLAHAGDFDGDTKEDPVLYSGGADFTIAFSSLDYDLQKISIPDNGSIAANASLRPFVARPFGPKSASLVLLGSSSRVYALSYMHDAHSWRADVLSVRDSLMRNSLSSEGRTELFFADFDGNGFDEPGLASFVDTGAENYFLWRYFALGKARSGALFYYAPHNSTRKWGARGDLPAPGDYNGDGLFDIAILRRGSWHVTTQKERFPTGFPRNFTLKLGKAGDIPVQGFCDGDKITDLGVYRRRKGAGSLWVVLLSKTKRRLRFEFGLGSDIPQLADYTGDGLADVAVFRKEKGGTKVIYRSSESSYSNEEFIAMGDNTAAVFVSSGSKNY